MKYRCIGVLVCLTALGLTGAGCSGGGGSGPGCPDGGADGGQVELSPCKYTGPAGVGLLGPEHLVYRGAFRLPQLGEDPPRVFSYGGRAMTHYPDGDPAGQDRFRGSLFLAGNDAEDGWERRRACWVAELGIPEPVVSREVSALPVAAVLQGLTDLRGEALYGPNIFFELPKHGLQVVREKGVDYLAMVFGQHIENEQIPPDCTGQTDPSYVPPLAARPLGAQGQLTAAATLGPWWIGGASLYALNDYLFEIPMSFATQHLGGRRLAAGRFRDGGQGSRGPVLVAVDPWLGGQATPAAGAQLPGVVLLHYSREGESGGLQRGYQHPDEWVGGAWLETQNRSSVIFAGAKAIGPRSWYGWQRCPCGEAPCAEREEIGGPGCFEADQSRCPASLVTYCECGQQGCDPNCFGERGWWTHGWEAQLLFYDPAELARVAAPASSRPTSPSPMPAWDWPTGCS